MSEQSIDLDDEVVETEDGAETEAEEVTEAEVEEDVAEDEEIEGDEEDEEPETIEIDIGGNKVELPKGSIPDEVAEKIEGYGKGLQADYTRKTQDIAEKAKSLEAREKGLEQLSALNQETLSAYAKAMHLKGEVEQLQGVDMDQLWQSDPDQARRISDHISAKQAEFQNTVAEVSHKEQELTQAQQAELVRRAEEGKALIEKRVPGFDEKQVVDYAVSTYGMTREQAETWPLNPATAEMAYKAMMFDQMQAKAKKPVPKKAAPAEPVKPMKTAGKANRKVDLVRDADKMSTDEWMRRRNAELAKRRAG